MVKINVHEAKTHLSRYLDRVEAGETIVLCRHNKPIAELRAIPNQQRKPRVAGLDKGKFEVGPEFFEPLPPEILRVFMGEGD
jgi:antitoxin (DNA-binding transcriptional repressor) of toxin-antitoxin stability system